MAKKPRTARPANEHAVNIATRHQVLLERIKAGMIRDYASVTRQLDRAVRETVGLLDTASPAARQQLDDLLRQLKLQQEQTYETWSRKLFDQLRILSGDEADFEAAFLRELTTASARVQAVSAMNAYAATLARPISATGELLTPFVEDWTRGEIAMINNTIRQGFTNGLTNQQIITLIRGTKANNFQDGILARDERNAAMVVRTSVQHVASTSRAAVWAANSDILVGYRWISTLDSKTTIQCRSLDQQVFPIGEGPLPPIHPGCRSTTIAEVNQKYAIPDEGGTRSSAEGYVSADLSYYQWLKGQSKTFQEEALGETRAKLFRQGGLSADEFARLNLGRDFQPLTLDEMRKKAPIVFERAGVGKP